MIHVRTKIDRPSPETIAVFQSLGTATIHEASGRKGAIDYAIRAISEGMRVCGPAFTVQCAPGDNLMLHKALECAQAGDVIVATVGGEYEYGYWGGLMAVSAMAKGLGGLAIDGCIRDSQEIVEMGFPVFSRGFSIRGTVKENLGLINYSMVFGRIMLNPGDLIVGDADGMVVVKKEDCVEVLEKAQKRVSLEQEKTKVLRSGVSSVKNNNLDIVFDSLGLVVE